MSSLAIRSLLGLGAVAATAMGPAVGYAQNLVHLWAFEQPLGFTEDFPDSSGNGHTGSGAGDIIVGKFGNAVKLLPGTDPSTGGIGDGIDWVDDTPENSVLPTAATDSWSLSFWASYDEAPLDLVYAAGFGIDTEESDGNRYKARSVINRSDSRGYHFWGASVDLSSNIAMPADSEWHMYTVTYDGDSTELTMYFDGVQAASTTFGGSGPFLDAPAEAHVGNPSNWSANRENFSGSVDEFGIWDGVLSADQIGGLFVSNDINQTAELQVFAEVDRATGVVTLRNMTGSNLDSITGFRVSSTAGALDSSEWVSIAGSVDTENWTSLDAGPYELSESDPGAAAGVFASGDTISLGPIWLANPTEDLQIEFLIDDGAEGATESAVVEYVGNGGESLLRSDLDASGAIDLADWEIFTRNGFTSLDGLSPVQAYLRGDLDGDGDNDRLDFRLFKSDYIGANGAAAFAALTAGVPEPASASLGLLSVLIAGVTGHRHNRR